MHTSRTIRGGIPAWASTLIAAMLTLIAGSTLAGDEFLRKGKGDDSRHVRANVLPAGDKVLGYSLQDMARATANFNVSDHGSSSVPVPNTPFQFLYTSAANPDNEFRIMQGRALYVPVVYVDNTPTVLGTFPGSAENHQQLLKYFYSQLQIGTVVVQITVDGNTKELGGTYLAGVDFASPLSNGATKYITSAAFISPLPPGRHSVSIRFKATGDAFRESPFDEIFPDGFADFGVTTYTLTVH